MKIVYMGTPDFAVEALEALVSSKHEVIAVFTQPDKPKGRGKAMQFTPVKEVAVRENIPVYQPQKIRDPEVVEQIRALVPDVLVVVAFGQIIPQEILDIRVHLSHIVRQTLDLHMARHIPVFHKLSGLTDQLHHFIDIHAHRFPSSCFLNSFKIS